MLGRRSHLFLFIVLSSVVLSLSDEESADPPLNATGVESRQLPSNATNVTDPAETNATANNRKIQNCSEPENPHLQVTLLPGNEISKILSNGRNECSLLIFYSVECYFSTRSAPYLNGFQRYYPNIGLMAVQINESASLSLRYGVVAIPTILLLHNTRAVAKLNHTNTSLESLGLFIERHTGISLVENMTILPEDYVGPLPTEVVVKPDLFLWLAWAFSLITLLYLSLSSSHAAKMYNWFLARWRESLQQEARPHRD